MTAARIERAHQTAIVMHSWQRPALMLALGVTTLAARVSLGPLTTDDAFITFRYARDLATGMGFVYNPGEHVIGTTTPLWTVLLAATYFVGIHNLPWTALTLGALADAATAMLLYRLVDDITHSRRLGVLGALTFVLCPLSITYTVGGMESPLFTLLVFSAAMSDCAERHELAALFAGAATITRPEGILLGALILGRHLLARRLPAARTVVIYVTPVLIWSLFSLWFTGSPIPHSVIAKSLVYQHQTSRLGGAFIFILRPFLPGMDRGALSQATGIARIGTLFCALFILNVVLVSAAGRWKECLKVVLSGSHWLPLALFAPLLIIAHAIALLRGVQSFDWYLVPTAPFFVLGAVKVVQELRLRQFRVLGAALSVVIPLYMAAGLSMGRHPGNMLRPLEATLVRENAYKKAAPYVASLVRPHMVLALPEIGTLGYATSARVLDTVGLVSPQSLRFYPLPTSFRSGSVPPALVRQEKPDLFVTLQVYLPDQLSRAAWFRKAYRLLRQYPVADGYTALLIFGRARQARFRAPRDTAPLGRLLVTQHNRDRLSRPGLTRPTPRTVSLLSGGEVPDSTSWGRAR